MSTVAQTHIPPAGVTEKDWKDLKSALLLEANTHGAYTAPHVSMTLSGVNPAFTEFDLDQATFPHILDASRQLVAQGHLVEDHLNSLSTNPNDIVFRRS